VILSPRQQLLAEQIRAIEEHQGVIAQPPTPVADLDFSTWLAARNRALQQQPQIDSAVRHAPLLFRRVLLAVLVLAGLAGALTCAKSLASAGAQLNIFWVLGVLLGLSWISLLLWLVTLALHREQAGVVAPLFSKLLDRLLPERPAPTSVQAADRVWFRRLFFSRAGAMRLGWITHGIWSAYLLGGVLGLTLLFTTRQFDFVWESTLLGGDSFVQITHWLTPPLEALGLPVPDTSQILASGLGDTGQAAGARRTWALFLLGCVLVYGLVPRLLAGLICRLLEWRLQRRETLDLGQTYYIRLQREFWPRHTPPRVLDADPGPDLRQSPPAGSGDIARAALPAHCLWLGLELPQHCAPPAVAQGTLINIQDEQSLDQARRLMESQSAPVALLIDGNKAADRGLQRIVLQLAEHIGRKNLWLVLSERPTQAKWQSWLQAAARAGLTPAQVTTL
jgi:hypothetical protein